jgi:hypothetical protein
MLARVAGRTGGRCWPASPNAAGLRSRVTQTRASLTEEAEFGPYLLLTDCRARKLDHHRGLKQGRGVNADFATVPLLWDRPFAPKDGLMDWSNSDGTSGSFSGGARILVDEAVERCLRTITPPSGIGWGSGGRRPRAR